MSYKCLISVFLGIHILNLSAQIDLYPGDDLQAIVDTHPAGTEFILNSGEYRLQTITARTGDSFIGELGANGERLAIMKGSQILQNFIQGNDSNGSYWYLENVIGMVSPNHGTCLTGFDCQRAEDIFINGLPQNKVLSLAEMDIIGECFIDGGTVYIRSNPNGNFVEASVNKFAIRGEQASGGDTYGASFVTIKNLIIEQYANPAQHGAIHAGFSNQVHLPEKMGEAWVIENNELRYNHGVGLFIYTDGLSKNNTVHDNGQMGLKGSGDNIIIQDNTVYNNGEWGGYSWSWEGGGSKFSFTDSIQILDNHVYDNNGPGLWTDIDNHNSFYEGNLVENNLGPGIFHEISYNAIIQCNTLLDNWNSVGVGNLYGANIFISNASNVEVVNNICKSSGLPRGNSVIVNCASRFNSDNEPYFSNDNYIHDNDLIFTSTDNYCGALITSNCTEANGNIFENNRYHTVDDLNNHNHLLWGANSGTTGNLDWFQGFGQGLGSDFDSNTILPDYPYDCNLSVADILIIEDCIQVFPNPSAGEFTIIGELNLYQLEIIDATGQIHQSIDPVGETHTIDLSNLPTGLYFIRVSNINNVLVELQKIIKE